MPAIELITLPKLGQKYHSDKALEEEHFAIRADTTKNVIKARLAAYGLPSSGTRIALLERLREFSTSKDKWISLFEPTKKRKRGIHTGQKGSSFSSQRIHAKFGREDDSVAYHSKKGVGRVQRTLQDSDRQANSAWAQAVVAYFKIGADLRPVLGPVDARHDHVMGGGQTEDSGNTDVRLQPQGDSEEDSAALTHRMQRFQRHLFRRVDEVEGKIDQMLYLHTSSSAPIPDAASASQLHQHKLASAPAPPTQSSSSPSVAKTPSTAETLPREEIPAANLAIAHLGGEDFAYDKSTLQGPPLIHLSGDIERLCHEWESSNLLVVNGCGIPVKYWGEFFKKSKVCGKESTWNSIKSEWGNWKFIAEEWQCFPNAEAFWKEYSDPTTGSRLRYQQILNQVTLRRTANATRDAFNARTFFGGRLDHPDANGAFQYLKNGQTHALSKNDAIAKKWRELLENDPDIASRFMQMHPLLHSPV